jgi:hypothetical protein
MRALMRGHRAVEAEDEASLIAAMNLATQGSVDEVREGIERRLARAPAPAPDAADDGDDGLAEAAAAFGLTLVERE